MDRAEKAAMREFIGQHLDVSGSRFSDAQAQRLVDFIENYDQYRGQTTTERSSHTGWSSDGKFERHVTVTETFTETVGIHRESSYSDDDGQAGTSAHDITTARGILDWLDANR